MRDRSIAAFLIAVVVVLAGAAAIARQSRVSGAQEGAVAAGSAVLRGVVVTDTADPQPVRRAAVRLAGAGSTSRLTGTDDEGRFVFDRLPPGRFTLSASKAGFVETFHGSTRPGRGPGSPVAVADGASVDVVIRLARGAVITGRIADERGNPVPGIGVAAVDARMSAGAPRAPARTITDDRGIYRLFGLAPGEYLVSAEPRFDPVRASRAGPGAAAVIAVTEADVQRARAAIAGAGSAGAAVGAGGASGGSGGPVPPARPVAYAPVFHPGTTDAAAAAPIRVAAGDERAGIDMTLRVVSLARVSGTLTDAAGQPVTSAMVVLVPNQDEQASPVDALVASGAIALPRGTVSADGFVFSGVAPGQYTLIARTGSGQRGAVAAAAAMPPEWSATDLVVDGNDRTDLALTVRPGPTVSGRLVFEGASSAPVDPAGLNLSLVGTAPIPGVASTFRAAVQPEGSFRVPSLAPGSYVVRAEAAASADGARWFLKSAIVDGRDLADYPWAAPADGTELSGLVVIVSDRMAEIAGRLVDATGQPVTRYSIVVVTTDRALWLPTARRIRAAQPATDGTFAMSGLPPGEYAIAAVEDLEEGDLSSEAFLSELLTSAVTLRVAEGESRRQDLQVGR
jgi:protocatechuate 3,4-dioxygenase beta subunit